MRNAARSAAIHRAAGRRRGHRRELRECPRASAEAATAPRRRPVIARRRLDHPHARNAPYSRAAHPLEGSGRPFQVTPAGRGTTITPREHPAAFDAANCASPKSGVQAARPGAGPGGGSERRSLAAVDGGSGPYVAGQRRGRCRARRTCLPSRRLVVGCFRHRVRGVDLVDQRIDRATRPGEHLSQTLQRHRQLPLLRSIVASGRDERGGRLPLRALKDTGGRALRWPGVGQGTFTSSRGGARLADLDTDDDQADTHVGLPATPTRQPLRAYADQSFRQGDRTSRGARPRAARGCEAGDDETAPGARARDRRRGRGRCPTFSRYTVWGGPKAPTSIAVTGTRGSTEKSSRSSSTNNGLVAANAVRARSSRTTSP